MRAIACLLLAACGLAGCANAPPVREQAPSEPIRAASLQQDIDILEQSFRALHPGLHRYNSPAQLETGFAALRRELAVDATLPEAYLAFSRFTASLRCGHTYANPVNQSMAVATRLFESNTRLPFHFRWIEGRMVVLRNFSGDPGLAPGTSVLEINGVPSERILATMLPLVRADGHNDAKRLSLLEVMGREKFETFDVLLPMLFPDIGTRPSLRVQSPGDAAPRVLSVATQSWPQRLAQRVDAAPAKGEPVWSLRRLDGGIALLDMPTWALYDGEWDWHQWLQGMFDDPQLQGARALVVDLRRNEGGSDVGPELLSHLIDVEVPLPGYLRKTRYRSSPPALRPYLDTWDPGFHDWGEAAQPMADGFFRLELDGRSSMGEPILPDTPRYRGHVYVLISAVNSSATFEFARAVRRAGAGTLVGQATGGNQRGINGGGFFFLNLPHSRIEIDLPLIGLFPTSPQPDAGVQPDILVPVTAADIAAGRDAELDAVRADMARHAPSR